MRKRISIALSSDVLTAIDRNAGSKASRSAFIENVLREYFKEKVREALNARDVELINANADYLNREMEDVLRYQAPIDFSSEERGDMRRGELYRVHQPPGDAKQHRIFVVVSRQALIDARFPTLICAPVFTNGQGLPTQVSIGPDEGLKHTSWIVCDNLRRIPKSDLTQYVGSLSTEKLAELDRALVMALDLHF